MSHPFTLPASWQSVLANELEKPSMHTLQQFVAEERQHHTIYPPASEMFAALELTP